MGLILPVLRAALNPIQSPQRFQQSVPCHPLPLRPFVQGEQQIPGILIPLKKRVVGVKIGNHLKIQKCAEHKASQCQRDARCPKSPSPGVERFSGQLPLDAEHSRNQAEPPHFHGRGFPASPHRFQGSQSRQPSGGQPGRYPHSGQADRKGQKDHRSRKIKYRPHGAADSQVLRQAAGHSHKPIAAARPKGDSRQNRKQAQGHGFLEQHGPDLSRGSAHALHHSQLLHPALHGNRKRAVNHHGKGNTHHGQETQIKKQKLGRILLLLRREDQILVQQLVVILGAHSTIFPVPTDQPGQLLRVLVNAPGIFKPEGEDHFPALLVRRQLRPAHIVKALRRCQGLRIQIPPQPSLPIPFLRGDQTVLVLPHIVKNSADCRDQERRDQRRHRDGNTCGPVAPDIVQ